MAISVSDISLVLSGGTNNSNPNLALGGPPSSNTVSTSINNLFSDVNPTEASTGLLDYRCLYIFNDGENPVYNFKLWIDSQVDGGSTIQLGVQNQNEVQRIAIGGTVTGGSFNLTFKGVEFTSNFNSDLSIWATNLQSSLNSLISEDNELLLRQVTVAARQTSSAIIFDVTFGGIDGSRDQDLLVVSANNLTPSVNIDIQLLFQGSPINTIAPAIDRDTTSPGGVTFRDTSADQPILLPKLDPTEGFPFWIQRTTASGSGAEELDGFTLKASMEALNPLG
jgi:hypothetical protein